MGKYKPLVRVLQNWKDAIPDGLEKFKIECNDVSICLYGPQTDHEIEEIGRGYKKNKGHFE